MKVSWVCEKKSENLAGGIYDVIKINFRHAWTKMCTFVCQIVVVVVNVVVINVAVVNVVASINTQRHFSWLIAALCRRVVAALTQSIV